MQAWRSGFRADRLKPFHRLNCAASLIFKKPYHIISSLPAKRLNSHALQALFIALSCARPTLTGAFSRVFWGRSRILFERYGKHNKRVFFADRASFAAPFSNPSKERPDAAFPYPPNLTKNSFYRPHIRIFRSCRASFAQTLCSSCKRF